MEITRVARPRRRSVVTRRSFRDTGAVLVANGALVAGVLLLPTPTVAAPVAAPAAPVAPVAAAVEDIDPSALVRGADAKVPYLQDGVIRAHGRSLKVGLKGEGGRQVMLGTAGKDRLVATAIDGYVKVHRIRRGKKPRLVLKAKESYNPSRSVGVRLSRGGKYLYWTELNRGGTMTTGRRVADGTPIALEDPVGGDAPFDAAGRRVLQAGSAGAENARRPATYIWTAPLTGEGGTDTLLAPRAASGGFLTRDVVFLRTTAKGLFGPTSISSPGTPAWSARFTPLDLSPNGRRVLGVATDKVKGRDVLQLRRMSDGKVLRSWAYGPAVGTSGVGKEQSARFESDSRVVFEVTRAGRSALVRCRTTGRCTRASKLGGSVSFSHEKFRWSAGPV